MFNLLPISFIFLTVTSFFFLIVQITFILNNQGKLYFSLYDPFNVHLNVPATLILAFLLHHSWDHVSTESFSFCIAPFLLSVDCDWLILFMLLLFLSLADWLLEWIWEICLYSGAAGYQRVLLCGKQNHCGHYYYGTLSKAAFKYAEPWSLLPFQV